jgi:hypothetical protein
LRGRSPTSTERSTTPGESHGKTAVRPACRRADSRLRQCSAMSPESRRIRAEVSCFP